MNFISKMSHHLNGWFIASTPCEENNSNSELHLHALEDRVLYSAAPFPVELLVDAPTVDTTIENVEQQLDLLTEAMESLQQESIESTHYQFDANEATDANGNLIELPTGFELVVIDRSVEDHESLLNDILANRNPDLVTVRFINTNADGVREIGRLLSETSEIGIGYRNYDAVHIVSHGDAGEIQLGNVTLDSDSLSQHADDIASWRKGLAFDADILIYGCNLAATADGISLVDSISELSEADVAASDDVTGHAESQGDWELEYVAGVVDHDVVFSSSLLESWNHSLQTTLGDESGTSHNAIGANYFGDQTIVSSTDDSGSWDVQVSRYSHLDSETPLKLYDGTDFENIQVNNDSAPVGGDHRHAVVGSAPNGNFVVAWVWSNDSGTVTEVLAKIYDAEGNVIKDQFRVGSPGINSRNVSVSMNELGNFAIAWEQHNGTDNDVMVSTFDGNGNVLHGPIQVADESTEVEHSNVVVSYNDQSRAVLAYNGPDTDTIYVRVLGGGILSNEFTFATENVGSVRDLAVDINDNSVIGVAFVADAGPGGSENQDVYSLLLQYDNSSGNMFNRSPTTQVGNGFPGVSAQVFRHSGFDAGLEFAPSIAVENNVFVGPNEETTFHVTWHGQGSWQSNLDAGTVTDASGNPVTNSSSFPGGTVVANSGVFISETTYVSDGSFTQLAEASLQNSLTDFDSASKNTSIVAFQDRSEIATVFETAAGVVESGNSAQNQVPVALDSTMTGLENHAKPFTVGDFGIDDTEGDPLQQIRIETLPNTGILTLFGIPVTQADIDATSNGIEVHVDNFGQLRYQGPDEVYGPNVATFLFSVSDGVSWSTAPAQMMLSISAEDRLWLSTVGETADIPGDGDGTLQFGGPTLTFGEDTFGYWSEQFSPDGLSIDAVHYVHTTIQLGTTGVATVNRGDVLFSADSILPTGPGPIGPPDGAAVLASLPSVGGVMVNVREGDIIRFRPIAGDYSTGEYVVIANVEQMYGTTLLNYDLNAFTLVAQDSILGDRLVKAGSFLFSDSENSNDVMLLELDETGSASTGTISLLIEGSEVGISDGNAISGLELIEAKTTAGEQVLDAGSLLVSIDQAETVGTDEGLLVNAQDIFVLKVGSTTTSSPAEASAAIFFEGADVGGDPQVSAPIFFEGGDPQVPDTAIDAVSLLGSADPSELLLPGSDSIELDENQVWRFQPSDFVDDATPNLVSVVITSLPNAANGGLTFQGQDVVVGQVIPADELGFLVYEPKFNLSVDSDSFGYRAVGEGSVHMERSIQIVVAPEANDALIGGGTDLHNVLEMDIEIAVPDGWVRTEPKIAALVDGGYVVLWRLESEDESSVYIQRFNSNHQKVGRLIDFTQGDSTAPRDMPRIVGLTDGGFVAIATRDLNDSTGPHIYVTQYDEFGQRVHIDPSVGSQHGTQLTTDGNGDQQAGDVAALQDGGFVVAFVDDEFGGQIKGTVVHDGAFVNEFDLTPTLAGTQYTDVSLASTKQGGFVATWIAKGSGVESVQARFFDVNGFPQSPVLTLGAAPGIDSPPSISVLANNHAVVVWSEVSGGDPSDAHEVVGYIFNADGDVVANDTVAFDDAELDPNVIALKDGGFLIAVSDSDIDGSQQSIAAHRFDSQFVRIGDAEVLNADSAGSQFAPDLAVLEGTGQVVGVWNTDSLGSSADVVGNAFLFESSAPVGDRIALDLTGSVVAGAGDTITNLTISNLPARTKVFVGGVGEIFGPVFDLMGYDPSTVEIVLPNGVNEAEYQLDIVTNDDGRVGHDSQTLRAVAVGAGKTISGTVYNDDNADGLIADEDGFHGVEVLLYEDVGGVRTEIDKTQTVDGYYEFTGLGSGTYFVVVDSTTIGNDVISDSSKVNRAWAEQTYGGDGSLKGTLDGPVESAGFLFGGRNALVSDDASSLLTSEHVNRQTFVASDTSATNVDFGFSFNVVTNVEDEYDAEDPNARTVQGSLRQFIENANHVDGPNKMRFVPIVGPNESSDADSDVATGDSWWSIAVVDELPEITSSSTILDGQAWAPQAGGLVPLDYNDFNVRNSYTGTVGTNELAFVGTDAPELAIIGTSSIDYGFRVLADATSSIVTGVEINNFSIYGFGDSASDAAIQIIGDDSGGAITLDQTKIQGNVIGSGPNDLDTETHISGLENRGILVTGATDGLISNNIVVGNESGGIRFNGAVATSNWTIVDNEIGDNARLSSNFDGIDATNVTELIIRRNAIYGNSGMGIDDHSNRLGSGNWIIEDNSIFDNGRNLKASGIRLTGSDSVVRYNSIYNNHHDGVTVAGFYDSSANVIVPASGNLISQNSFGANGQLAIDLIFDFFDGISFETYDADGDDQISSGESFGLLDTKFASIASSISDDGAISQAEAELFRTLQLAVGDGSNSNDGAANTNVANEGLDQPIVTSAEFEFGDLNLTFQIDNSNTDRVELYTVDPDDTGSDLEAWRYFKEIPIASMTDEGGGVFSVTIPASDFPASVPRDTPITALAIDANNNTSEFAPNVTPVVVNHAPEARDSNTRTDEEQDLTFSFAEFRKFDVDNDAIVELMITSLPAGSAGVLWLDGVEVSNGQTIPAGDVDRLMFVPVVDFAGTATFEFAVSDGTLVSNSATMSVEVINVQDAPTGLSQTITIDEDEIVSFTPESFGFMDADGDSFDGVRITSLGGGTLTLNSVAISTPRLISVAELPLLRFQPDADANGLGLSTIEFRVVDDGATNNEDVNATEALTYDVTPVNDAPETTPVVLAPIAEDSGVRMITQAELLANATDSEGDTLVASGLSITSGAGTLVDNGDGTWNYTPDVADNSDVSFGYAISDAVNSVAGSAILDIGPINNAPETIPVVLSPIAEDSGVRLITQAELLANATDAEGDALVADGLSITSGAGTLVDNGDGTWDYTPSQNDESEVSFEYTISDATDNVAGSATLDITPVNDAPETTPVVLDPIAEDSGVRMITQAELLANATDAEGDALVADGLSITSGAGTLVNNGDGTWNYTPNDNDDSEVSFEYTISDATSSVVGSVTLDIMLVNDRPAGEDLTIILDEESSYQLNADDFVINDPSDLMNPNNLKAIRVTGSSGHGTLTLDGIPVASGTIINVADIDRLVFEAGSVSADAVGTIRFVVIDDGGKSNGGEPESDSENTITFDVRQVNKAPVIESGQFDNVENSTESHLISVSDADLDPVALSFAGSGNDNGLFEFTPDGKSIRFVDGPNFESPNSINGGNVYTVELVATDSNGLAAAPHQILVTVENVVEVPVLRNDVLEDSGDGFGEVSIFDNDGFGGVMPADASIRVIQPAEGFVVIAADGTVSFTPHAQFAGVTQTEFTYVFERGGEASTAVVQLKKNVGQSNNSNNEPNNSGSSNNPPANNQIEIEGPAPTQATNGPAQPVAQNLNEVLNTAAVSDSGADAVNYGFADSEIFNDLRLLAAQPDYSTYLYSSFVDTGLLTGEFASRIATSGRQGLQDLAEGAILNALFWQELESASHEYIKTELGEFESMITVGALGFSGVAITVIVRAALLGLSLGATYAQPGWMTSFDFLPIIDSEDKESIGQIVDRED